jgi:hypothetical protein
VPHHEHAQVDGIEEDDPDFERAVLQGGAK